MKINRIGNIVKKSGVIYLVNKAGCQWTGDGRALYLLENLPVFEDKNVLSLFDIAEKDRDRYYIKSDEDNYGIDFSDTDEDEKILERLDTNIIHKGAVILPLRSRNGIIFINGKYLNPFDEKEDFELYERRMASGTRYVAVKAGFMLKGLILPMMLHEDEMIKELEEIHRQAKRNSDLLEEDRQIEFKDE